LSRESGEIRKRKAAKGTKTGSNAKGKFAGSLKENTKGRKALKRGGTPTCAAGIGISNNRTRNIE
jgi:hypothetical protein